MVLPRPDPHPAGAELKLRHDHAHRHNAADRDRGLLLPRREPERRPRRDRGAVPRRGPGERQAVGRDDPRRGAGRAVSTAAEQNDSPYRSGVTPPGITGYRPRPSATPAESGGNWGIAPVPRTPRPARRPGRCATSELTIRVESELLPKVLRRAGPARSRSARAVLRGRGPPDDHVDPRRLWKGRRVDVVTGSAVPMPDTPVDPREHLQPYTQKPGLGLGRGRSLARLGSPFSPGSDTHNRYRYRSDVSYRLGRSGLVGESDSGSCQLGVPPTAARVDVRGWRFRATKDRRIGLVDPSCCTYN